MSLDLFVARQPILDRDSRLFGYELLFRSGPENFFPGIDPDEASRRNIETSVMGFGLDALTGPGLAFVNASRSVLVDELYAVMPPNRTVIEVLESVEHDDEVLAACRRAKNAGYRLALDDYVGQDTDPRVLGMADILKVDVRATPPEVRRRIAAAHANRGTVLLAEKVETADVRRECLDEGYSYFQGYYFCRPEMLHGRDVPPSKLNTLRFLSEVNREDASMERIHAVILHELSLTVRLLRYLNSAGFGWRYEVTSIEHALRLLGLQPLRKWASLMAVVMLADDKPRPLIETALVRARHAEMAGALAGLDGRDQELFLTGLLSLIDAMIDRPLPEALAGMAVPGTVKQALLEGDSPLATVLRLVVGFERGDWEVVRAASDTLGLPADGAGSSFAQAVDWANRQNLN